MELLRDSSNTADRCSSLK